MWHRVGSAEYDLHVDSGNAIGTYLWRVLADVGGNVAADDRAPDMANCNSSRRSEKDARSRVVSRDRDWGRNCGGFLRNVLGIYAVVK